MREIAGSTPGLDFNLPICVSLRLFNHQDSLDYVYQEMPETDSFVLELSWGSGQIGVRPLSDPCLTPQKATHPAYVGKSHTSSMNGYILVSQLFFYPNMVD
jgi:hypothetical protein